MTSALPVEAVLVEQSSAEAATPEIWTHTQFAFPWTSPVKVLKEEGNEYVANQWSAEYYTNVKASLELASTAAKAMLVSFFQFQWFTGVKHFINTAIIGCKALTIEAGNLTKGALGIAISAIKGVQHITCFVLYLLAGMAALLTQHSAKAKELLGKSWNNLTWIGKDILTSLICLGQAMPPWLPFAILLFCHPAGIFLLIVQFSVKYTGLSDVLAYGGSAMLLFVQSKTALQTQTRLRQQESLTSEETEALAQAETVVRSWEKLKEELNPRKHNTATIVAIFAARILIEGVFTALCLVTSGAGTILTYVAEGLEGATAVGIITARVLAYLKEGTRVALPPIAQDEVEEAAEG